MLRADLISGIGDYFAVQQVSYQRDGLMDLNFSPLQESKQPVIDLVKRFQSATETPDIYAIAKALAAHAYMLKRDKGSGESIWHHVEAVKERVKTKYEGRVSGARLNRLKALAVLHEILEIKDAQGQPIWTAQDLLDAGLPRDFVDDVNALTIKNTALYLDDIRELALHPDAVLVKLCDLEENMSPRKIEMRAMTQTLIDKKAVLYPAAHAYLTAVSFGRVDPLHTSVKEFVMNDRYVHPDIQQGRLLSEYSSDKLRYPSRTIPGAQWVRAKVSRAFAGLGRGVLAI